MVFPVVPAVHVLCARGHPRLAHRGRLGYNKPIMALFTLQQVLTVTNGQLLVSGPGFHFTGVSTDTRALQPGDLFVAIKGERFNGHDFLEAAREKGAAGAVVEESIRGVRRRHTAFGEWNLIEVTDTLYALGRLAQSHRLRFKIPVIGITGSAGKTTTKELTAAILGHSQPILKTPENFNNEIGLPHTLFGLTADHQAAVVEFGMRGRGQINYLASLARPTIGIITNIGLTHLELLGSPEEIALAKAELLDEMPARTVAILPRDDAYYPLLRDHARGQVVTVGFNPACDVWADEVVLGADGCARFALRTRHGALPIRLGTPGRHQVSNAVAAAAAAISAEASDDDIVAGLALELPTAGRMQVRQTRQGVTVIDDTYNANPAAVRATLAFLAEMPGVRKIAILGDMRELGPAAEALHRDLGHYAMTLGLDALLAVGELGRAYVAGAADPRARWYPDNAAVSDALLREAAPGDVVLVKGSRAMHMDEIVGRLTADG